MTKQDSLKVWHSTNNARRPLNLISMSQHHNTKTIVMPLDAWKSTRKLLTNYTCLSSLSFTNLALESHLSSSYTAALYNSPKATVTANGLTSKSFTLQRGTRKGCPFLLLLFAIFIKRLATAVRQNTMCSSDSKQKIILYADHFLLCPQQC